MADICYRCLRPLDSCFCGELEPVETGIKFVFLMHPKEAKRQRTGTGRLASIRLPGSMILVGVDFSDNPHLNALLEDSQYYPVLMYPGEDATTLKSPGFRDSLAGRTLLVIIIDSTWSCSKKIIEQSRNLHGLPRLSFSGSYRSIFTFKREPAEYCVSTIESCYYIIREAQEAGIEDASVDPEPLMDVFKKMIRYQLNRENDRIKNGLPGNHAHDWKYTKIKEVPDFGIDN